MIRWNELKRRKEVRRNQHASLGTVVERSDEGAHSHSNNVKLMQPSDLALTIVVDVVVFAVPLSL